MQSFSSFPFYNFMSTGSMFDFPMTVNYEPSNYAYNDINQYQQPAIKDQNFKSEEKTNPGVVLKEQESQEYRLKQYFKEVKKSKIKTIQKQLDDDYKPYKKNKKKLKVPKQKENRNLIPNSVNHLLAYVQKRFKSGPLVQRIFALHKHPEKCNINRYYTYHKMLKQKINTYVNEEAIRIVTEVGFMEQNVFDIDEQLFYCKISRILIRKFLKQEAIFDILLSKKIKKKNMYQMLKIQRILYEAMKNQLS